MEFAQLMQQRRSVRAFQDTPVEEEKLLALAEAANRAPTAGNLQAFEMVAVTDPSARADLARAALDQTFIAEAPLVLVFLANGPRSSVKYGERGKKLYCVQDATIACTFAHLRAADLGLGSVWVGAFAEKDVARLVGGHEKLRPVAILPVGYPADEPEPGERRALEDVLHRGRVAEGR
jgi:nitroreductase